MKRFVGRTLFVFCAVISFNALAQKTQNSAATPITDNQGRIRYIIDFTKEATQGQPTHIEPDAPLNDGLPDWQKPEMRHFAKGIAKKYGLTPLSTTSWVGNSITAYLTHGQVQALENDERVTLITQDIYLGFSSNPPWGDGMSGSEKVSWGTTAVNGGNPIDHTGKGINVYVLDAGVGYHTDLGGYSSAQVQRYNPNLVPNQYPWQWFNPVGCYAHATHVAGIIGAQVNNSGTRGVNPGVPIISVSIGNYDNGACSTSQFNSVEAKVSDFAVGMDMVMLLVIQNGWYKPGILNISLNDYEATTEAANIFSYGNTLGNKMYALTIPYAGYSYHYAGVFIVQSAGNQLDDACIHAFDGYLGGGANPYDGIMVVGGIDYSGAPVNGYFYEPQGYTDLGSNYGRCVDTWAPAQQIWSTWGGSQFPTMDQASTVAYSTIDYLSGTSMAAPHISGLASYLAETQNLTTPTEIEAAVREHFRFFGYYDYQGFPIYMPVL